MVPAIRRLVHPQKKRLKTPILPKLSEREMVGCRSREVLKFERNVFSFFFFQIVFLFLLVLKEERREKREERRDRVLDPFLSPTGKTKPIPGISGGPSLHLFIIYFIFTLIFFIGIFFPLN